MVRQAAGQLRQLLALQRATLNRRLDSVGESQYSPDSEVRHCSPESRSKAAQFRLEIVGEG